MQKQIFENVPGLFLYKDYFDQRECTLLINKSLEMYKKLQEQVTPETTLKEVDIPQPKFVKSAQHNLNSSEFFVSLYFNDNEKRRCEYFPKYGEKGHALCYFRGNTNIPNFVYENAICKLQKTMHECNLTKEQQDLKWKLTANFYKSLGKKIAGFPFHVDIPANGVVTMIMNVQRQGLFQIAKEDVVEDIELTVGSLLILSGESRYEWKHRVLPETIDENSNNEVKRISLVLGFS
ncbi:hypothetical protein [Candidatus Uabimicrobium sp. HlEnr_7]|uniref:hypothetical protein n=1 Tax=Candidatus Uabimicrobium helgolandensis TaxID=3095367 RepID=UPI003556F27F